MWEPCQSGDQYRGQPRVRDPQPARALLDNMREIADKQNSPALWAQWAKAAINHVIALRAGDVGDIAAGQKLLGDVAEVAIKRDGAALWEHLDRLPHHILVRDKGQASPKFGSGRTASLP